MGRRDCIVSHPNVHVVGRLPNEVQGPRIGHQGCLSQYLRRLSWDQHWGTERLFASSKQLLASRLTATDNSNVSNTISHSSWAPKHRRVVIRSAEQCDREGDSSRSSFEIMIERRAYGRNEYATALNVSGLC